MNDLVFADDLLERIRASGAPYHDRAYLFVLAAIEYLQSGLDARRHVTAAELSWACRDFAQEQYGLMAQSVLEHWGVGRTDDVGRIVYILVEAGLLVTQPGDRESDFSAVYDFHEAFSGSYRWPGMARQQRG